MPRRENHSAAARDDEYTSAPFTAFLPNFTRGRCAQSASSRLPNGKRHFRALLRWAPCALLSVNLCFCFRHLCLPGRPISPNSRQSAASRALPFCGIYPVRRMAPSQSGAPSKEKDPALYARILLLHMASQPIPRYGTAKKAASRIEACAERTGGRPSYSPKR